VGVAQYSKGDHLPVVHFRPNGLFVHIRAILHRHHHPLKQLAHYCALFASFATMADDDDYGERDGDEEY
jgi:hypothetical protein